MPASASAIRAGRAFVELFADDTKLVRGLNAAQKRLKDFGATVAKIGAGIAAAGAAIVTPMLAAAKSFADVGSELVDMSGRTGVSVERLSELKYAADQSGTSMEGVEKSIRRMQKTLTAAADGEKSAADALDNLGLSAKQLQGLSPDEQFLAIGEALARIHDPAERAARAMEVFGKSGAELLPLFQDGAGGVRELMAEAKRLGITLSTEDAVAAEAFGDMLQKVQDIIGRTVVAVGAALGPALSNLADRFSGGAASIGEWVNENREVIRIVAAVGVALVAVGTAVAALGGLFTLLGTAAGLAASAIGAVDAVIAAIVSPVGLVTAALVAGVGAWLMYSETGQAAIGALGETFGTLKNDAIAAFQGISDALSAGDIALAGEVALAALNVVWATGWDAIAGTFYEVRNVLLGTWEQFGGLLLKIWYEVTNGLVRITAQVGSQIQGFFENLAADALNTLGIITDAEAEFAKSTTAKNREANLRQINSEYDPAKDIAAIDKSLSDAAAARASGTAADIQAAEAALDAARAKLAESVKKAADAKAAADATSAAKAPEKIRISIPDLDDLPDKLGGAADKIAKAQDQLPAIMAQGSKEAAEALLRNAFGGQDDDRLGRDQLAEQKKATTALRDIEKNLRNVQTISTANIA